MTPTIAQRGYRNHQRRKRARPIRENNDTPFLEEMLNIDEGARRLGEFAC